jgi:hypothetical protein
VNTPINVGTPLSTIPGNFSYSSQLIELDDVVVVVDEYYYNNSKRGIEKRSTKRKRVKNSPKGSSRQGDFMEIGTISSSQCLDNASSLSAFVGEN